MMLKSLRLTNTVHNQISGQREGSYAASFSQHQSPARRLSVAVLGLFLLLTSWLAAAQTENTQTQTIPGQYIVVYKKTASVQARIAAGQTYKVKQDVMRQEATSMLSRNKLPGKEIMQVYNTAIKGFAVKGLSPAEVNRLRQDDQVAYIVPDNMVYLSVEESSRTDTGKSSGGTPPNSNAQAGKAKASTSNCDGPSVTINGVPNYVIGLASFGPAEFNVTADAVLVNDGTAPVTDGCTPIINSVAGKIAIIDRGLCGFSEKALTAQQAGAVGVIILNNAAGAPPAMVGTAPSSTSVTIPVLSLSQADGNALKVALQSTTVTITMDQQLPDGSSQCTPWGITRVGGGGSGVGKRAWIIDTGVDLTHPDLTVNTALSTFFVGTSANDENGHGSHVAGTIAAKDNGIGVIGVAAGAEVVAVRVFPATGGTPTSVVIQGIDYVADRAVMADVANLSLGGSPNRAREEAIAALSTKCRIVVSAGNSAQNANFQGPARANGANIYTVSAMDITDRFASFSNYGNQPIDFAAPGVNVASCYMNGGYTYLSGTSMAAPTLRGFCY